MVKPRLRRRQTCRSSVRLNVRNHVRRLDRSCIRNLPGFHPGPDDFSQALTAFSRAIRAHRRLARLAPEFFDSTEMDRLAHHRKDDAEWMAMWEPALNKAYGPPPPGEPRRNPLDDVPQPPKSPRTRRAVEREFTNWCFWMDSGRLAMARHQHRRPHALPSLTRVARLLQIAFDFARLACGSYDPSADKSLGHAQALADLERAYGRPIPGEDTDSSQENTTDAEPNSAPADANAPAGPPQTPSA
ncbi:MAG TPA: hypothetical protein VLT36_11500 [Candidatus Dormibacteraeota bacterium]|nr:hypothetical protein [Candidatus Dormibacteraeota bacterium]